MIHRQKRKWEFQSQKCQNKRYQYSDHCDLIRIHDLIQYVVHMQPLFQIYLDRHALSIRLVQRKLRSVAPVSIIIA